MVETLIIHIEVKLDLIPPSLVSLVSLNGKIQDK